MLPPLPRLTGIKSQAQQLLIDDWRFSIIANIDNFNITTPLLHRHTSITIAPRSSLVEFTRGKHSNVAVFSEANFFQ